MKLQFSIARVVSGSAATALALGGLVAVGGSPAVAATSVTYACVVTVTGLPSQPVEVPVALSANLPTSLAPGQTVTPTLTANVVLPDEARKPLYDVGFRAGSGSVSATASVNGTARSATLGIPSTSIPASTGTFAPRATGSLGSVTAGVAGSQVTIDVTSFTAKLTLTPTVMGFNAATLSCSLPAGQSGRIATASVAGAPATPAPVVKKVAKVSAKPAKAKVKRGKVAVIKVAVTAPGVVPTGKVTVVIGKSRKVVALKGGKATASVRIAKKAKAGKVTVKVSYGGDSRVKAGSGTARLRITK